MAVDFSKIENLVPEEKVKTMQKIIEDLKKQIQEKQKEIKQAEEEIKTAETILEKADDEQRILELRAEQDLKISQKQFGKKDNEQKSDKKIEKDKTSTLEKINDTNQEEIPRMEERLEEIISTAPVKKAIEQIAQKPIDNLYNEMRRIYRREKETGIETQKDREILYVIMKGIEEKKQDVNEGTYKPTEKARHLMTAAEEMAENMYKGTTQMYKN